MTRNTHPRHGQIQKELRIPDTKVAPEIPTFASKKHKTVRPLR
jgi:hypothetical protein